MIKGDRRKQEILNTAEQLFCRKGFEQTSIQDILDMLDISKGSFYHHFISKESLLEEICCRRAEQIFQDAAAGITAGTDPVDHLNRLFSGMIPLPDEKLSFLMMLLPIFRLPEGQSVKTSYCDALSGLFRSAVTAELERGNESGSLICFRPHITAGICLDLVNRLWTGICEQILVSAENGTEADISELLILVDEYRNTLGKILTVPYGSFELVSIPTLKALCEQINVHWKE